MSKHDFTALTTFRGWSEEKGEWVYGHYNYGFHKYEVAPKHRIQKFRTNENCEVHPDSIGVYTGKDDKDDEPIFCGVAGAKYGGDKVKFKTMGGWNEAKVEFQEDGRFLPFCDDHYIQDEMGDWFDFGGDGDGMFKITSTQWEDHLAINGKTT